MSKLKQVAISEFFLKNKHQLGFGNVARATLTTIKEAVDNSLDACEDERILPNIKVTIKKLKQKNQKEDVLEITVYDNGPGIGEKDLGSVFGQLLVGSKFHSNKQQRGQQGIGIAAACMYGLTTTAVPAEVISKKKGKKAVKQLIKIDTKTNQSKIITNEKIEDTEWLKENKHGTIVKIQMDGKVQKGDRGVEFFLKSTAIANPHLSLEFSLPDKEPVILERKLDELPRLSKSTLPHIHSVELGEFIQMLRNSKYKKVKDGLTTCFTRVSGGILSKISSQNKKLLNKDLFDSKKLITDQEIKVLYNEFNDIVIPPPSTNVLSPIGPEGLLAGVERLGTPEFVEVVSRKPTICAHSAFQVEVCLASFPRLEKNEDEDSSVHIYRFANKVPLQFQFQADGIVHAVKKISWKSYGLNQKKGNIPDGPYVFIVSIIGSWLPFTNAAKEAINPTDELVEEIKLCLQEAGRKLAKHVKQKKKRKDIEEKVKYLQKYGPHVVQGISDILSLTSPKEKKLEKSLNSLLNKRLDSLEKK